MHSTVKKALMLAKNRRKYAGGGVPDDASQEAFLQEQLEGSAPQYEPQAENLAQGIAQGAATLTPPGAIADAAGYLGGPSALQNLKNQNYIDAALQLAAVVPGVGPLKTASKASREAQKLANAEHFIEWVDPSMKAGRRYKTEKQAIKSKPSEAKLVHTTIEDPVRYNNPIKKADGGDVNFGRPDEASQEAFLQEQLQGSAPQYMPEEGMLTGKRAGLMAAGFAPGAGIATAAGQFPTAEGGKEPSMAEDLRKGEYLSAGLKGLGAAGDIAYGVPLVGPAVGAAMKAPLVAKLAMAAAPMAKIAGEVAPATEAVSRITNPIGMYSAAAEAARALPQEKGTLQQMLATMKGVTPEELHWSGVHEAFAGKPTVTREELAKHFEERLPGVSETVLVNEPIKGSGWESVEGETKFGEYTIPGGENYREVVLHIPHEKMQRVGVTSTGHIFTEKELEDPIVRKTAEKIGLTMEDRLMPTMQPFKSQHWSQPNVLSHLRMSDRTGPEGEKILHLEELQSDWGQRGRKEGFEQQYPEFFVKNKRSGFSSETFKTREEAENYQNSLPESLRPSTAIIEQTKKIEGLPSAPYVASPEGKHTLSWVDLGLKRALKEAAEGGYDKLIWTPGEEQAARYDLSKQVRSIDWNEYESDRHPGVNKIVQIEPIKGNTIELPVDSKGRVAENVGTEFDGKPLDEVIGKDLANKILNDRDGSLSGSGLQIGGEGMKKFYDKIVPSQLKKLLKKIDPHVKVVTDYIKTGDEWPFSVRIASDGENYWLAGKSPYAEGEQSLSGKFSSYEDADKQRDLLYSGYHKPVHSIKITPKMREAISKGFAAYADGGAVKSRDSSHLDPIIQRGMTAVKRAKSQNGGSKMMINRKMYEPIRGLKIKQPPEELSDEPDIRSYQLKRHSHEFIGSPEPEAPKRSVYLDAPLFGVRKKLFDMPYYYQPAVQKALNFAYGQKTTPFYLFEPTAPLARAIDAYETTKFIQRDPKSFSSYTGVPGTLMGITKMGVPAVASGAYLAGDGPADQGPATKTLPDFDFGETFNVISHPKRAPEIKKEEDFMKYAKGGGVDDEFHALMAEADDLLEKFKE